MKKVIVLFLTIVILTGCDLMKKLDNTPTKKVEAFLNKYQMLDEDVIDDLNAMVNKKTQYSEKQKEEYISIVKKNYQKMTYTIKEENVDGEEALVTAEIEVVDYSNISTESNKYLKDHPEAFLTDGKYDESLFIDYIISKMKEAKEKIKYTVNFDLTKVDKEWELDDITNETIEKLNGSY